MKKKISSIPLFVGHMCVIIILFYRIVFNL